ncbi:extracellular calcium-sensing receptor-like [Mixophyes fleayi]|uniref:extracellular calcium-sensing receptor-like n=1 Tax=Mixophyes fleayi TaxID=3061075 RepID=UPI003F4E2715
MKNRDRRQMDSKNVAGVYYTGGNVVAESGGRWSVRREPQSGTQAVNEQDSNSGSKSKGTEDGTGVRQAETFVAVTLLQSQSEISPISSVSLLSNQKMFPSFFRAVPSDKMQSMGLAQLVLSFGWTWIGLIATDNDYGLLGIQPIKEELIKAGACVAFIEYIRLGQPNHNAPHIVKVIKESTVKVVIVFSVEADFVPVVNEMLKQNITGRIFIGNAGWSRSVLLSTRIYFHVLSSVLGLAGSNYVVPGLSQFLSKIHPSESMGENWVNLYWEKVFKCKFLYGKNLTGSLETPVKECTGEESLDNVKNSPTYISSFKFSYYTYDSINVLAKALEDLKSCKEGDGPFSHGTCADIWNFKPWQLTNYIRKVRFTPAGYGIVNWQLSPEGTVKQIQIGNYSPTAIPDQALTIDSSLLLWSMGSQQCGRKPKDPEETQDNRGRANKLLTDKATRMPGRYYLGTQTVASAAFLIDVRQQLESTDNITDGQAVRKDLPEQTKVPRSVCSESCPPGFRKAARTGQPVCCFDCVQCLQGEISNQTDSITCIRCPWDQWSNPEKSRCLPKSMEFLSYDDALGGTLAAISIISSLIPALILKLFILYRQTPIVRANNYSLSCLLLMSLCLCFLCSVVFIGYPHQHKCLLRQVLFGLAFTLCVSSILAKTIMVVFAFMATRPGSNLRKWTSPQVSYMIVFTCFLLQFFLCITWLSVASPFPHYNTNTKPELIIVECNEGSPIAFWTMLGYLFLLATISFIVAFLARNLPDRFNEAQFISFSMLAFLSVWVAFIPASLSAQGKYTVAMEIFAILASSWALVICMFLPKCFIILFRPNKNCRQLITKNKD